MLPAGESIEGTDTTGNDTQISDGNGGKELSQMELAWRHIKKPLLRIGKNGLSTNHANSLKELLEQHNVVKIKINTNRLGKEEVAKLF